MEDMYTINGLVKRLLKNLYGKHIHHTSLVGENIKKILESENCLIDALEKVLQPKYMNDVFTWAQIKKALETDVIHLNSNEPGAVSSHEAEKGVCPKCKKGYLIYYANDTYCSESKCDYHE